MNGPDRARVAMDEPIRFAYRYSLTVND